MRTAFLSVLLLTSAATGPVYACGQISTGFLNPADPIGSAVTKFSFTVRRIAPLGTYDAPGVIDIPSGGNGAVIVHGCRP